MSLTIQQVLKASSAGGFVFGKEGDLIFEWEPEYASSPNVGAGYIGIDLSRVSRSHLYRFSGGSSRISPLFQQSADTGYWIGGASPAGHQLAIFSMRGADVRIGTVRTDGGELRWLDITPDYSWWIKAPVWISNTQFIYPTLDPPHLPDIAFKPATARNLNRLWEATFSGTGAAATVRESWPDGLVRPSRLRRGGLSLISVDTGEVERIAEGGAFYSLEPAPSGNVFAAVRLVSGVQPPERFTFLPRPNPSFGHRFELILLQRQPDGRWNVQSPCGDCVVDHDSLRWSLDSNSLAFVALRDGRERRHFVLDRRSGQTTLNNAGPCWAGSGIGVLNGQVVAQRGRQVYLVDFRCASRPIVSLQLGETATGARREPRRDGFIVQTDRRVYSLGRRESSPLSLANPNSTWTAVAMPDSARGVGLFQSNSENGSQAFHLVGERAPSPFLELNPWRDTIEFSPRRNVEFIFEGRTVRSCVYLPPGRAPEGRRYPTILYAYPDIRGGCDQAPVGRVDTGLFSLELLAARGYAVMVLPAPHDLVFRADGGARENVEGQIADAALDAGVAAGIVDGERVGVYGLSMGMLQALTIARQVRRVRAVVASYGYTDLFSQYLNTVHRYDVSDDPGRLENSTNYSGFESPNYAYGTGGSPSQVPDRYIRRSPALNAAEITAPVLMFHSDFDGFEPTQAEEMFSALYRLRRRVRFITFWGEDHGVRSPENAKMQWYEMFSWFDTHLDVARTAQGQIAYDGDVPRARGAAPAWAPDDFARMEEAQLGAQRGDSRVLAAERGH